MKLKFPWNIIVTGVCSFALGFPLMGLIDRLNAAQAPTTMFPDHDVAYTCTPSDGNGAPVQFKFTPVPSPRFEVSVGNKTPNGDSLNPVLNSITNSAGTDITTGAVRLLAANNGLAITVNATDNVGIVTGKLEMDGVLATPFGNGLDVLPNPFYVRWNSKTIGLGSHAFRLSVCDAALNCTQRTWSMTR